ncbi:MAG: NAD(P)-binding domain-containing protein [Myxococcota bacterium]
MTASASTAYDSGRYCIIGAGPGGISVARAFGRAGIPYDLVERHSDVGGIWDIDNPGSPVYESAHFISSSGISHFAGVPMPEDYPDYPSHERILAYLRGVAAREGLYSHLRASTEVVRAERIDEGWRVVLRGCHGTETTDYAGIVCASGTTWHPKMPSWPGVFAGEVVHSSRYRSAAELAGRRVLVVGAGNSGCDIASDAATAAKAAFISMRRGYHFIPKHVFGMPTDVFADKSKYMPMALRRWVFERILCILNGDVTKLGLPAPDHPLLASHPITNDQLLHYLRHGDISVKPDVKRLDGLELEFVDGTRERIDLVICATGYETRTPYLPEETLPTRGGRPDLYLNIFSRSHRDLFCTGFLESNSGLFKLFDLMAHTIAQAVLARRDPAANTKFRRRVEQHAPDLSGGIRYVESDRHANYVNIDAYRAALTDLCKRMEWPSFDPDGLALLPPAVEVQEARDWKRTSASVRGL